MVCKFSNVRPPPHPIQLKTFGSPLTYQQKLNLTITDIVKRPDVRYPDFTNSNVQQSCNAVLPENQLNKIMGMNITDTSKKRSGGANETSGPQQNLA